MADTEEDPLEVSRILGWTLFQCIFHVLVVLYFISWTSCLSLPTYYDGAFIYLTYFYQSSCPLKVSNYSLFINGGPYEAYTINTVVHSSMTERIYENRTYETQLYSFINDVLSNKLLPIESDKSGRTHIYLQLFIIMDVLLGIVSGFIIVMSKTMKTVQRPRIAMYIPWILISASTIILDCVFCIHYIVDATVLHSYTDWLKFVGVKNYDYFKRYIYAYNEPRSLPMFPSIVLTIIFGRFLFIWVANVCCLDYISSMFISELRHNYRMEHYSGKTSSRRNEVMDTHNADLSELQFNSSEARLRNFRHFYGANETITNFDNQLSITTEDIIGSTSVIPPTTSDKANNWENISTSYLNNDSRKNSSRINSPDGFFNTSTGEFRRNSDITQGIDLLPVVATRTNSILLRNQLPWSYTERRFAEQHQSSSSRMQSVPIDVIQSTQF